MQINTKFYFVYISLAKIQSRKILRFDNGCSED